MKNEQNETETSKGAFYRKHTKKLKFCSSFPIHSRHYGQQKYQLMIGFVCFLVSSYIRAISN